MEAGICCVSDSDDSAHGGQLHCCDVSSSGRYRAETMNVHSNSLNDKIVRTLIWLLNSTPATYKRVLTFNTPYYHLLELYINFLFTEIKREIMQNYLYGNVFLWLYEKGETQLEALVLIDVFIFLCQLQFFSNYLFLNQFSCNIDSRSIGKINY